MKNGFELYAFPLFWFKLKPTTSSFLLALHLKLKKNTVGKLWILENKRNSA